MWIFGYCFILTMDYKHGINGTYGIAFFTTNNNFQHKSIFENFMMTLIHNILLHVAFSVNFISLIIALSNFNTFFYI